MPNTKTEFPIGEEEMEEVLGEWVNRPEVANNIEKQLKDAPVVFINVCAVIMNDGKQRKTEIISTISGLTNPGRKFGFPPKAIRDAAAKEMTRSLRKNISGLMNAFAKGVESKLASPGNALLIGANGKTEKEKV